MPPRKMVPMLERAKPGKGSADSRRLYLFSSNAQPLYARHALNVLAMPAGQRTTFRYSSEWINEAAERDWGPRLHGQRVLMHFAVQQHYSEPALFPLRTGRVVNADRKGPYHFVEVEIGDYVALKWPIPAGEKGQLSEEQLQRPVAAYRALLDAHEVGRPYPNSAALSEDVLQGACSELIDVGPAGDPQHRDIECFRQSAEFLQRTESFRSTRFIRFLGLTKQGAADSSAQSKLAGDPPCLHATAGRTYEIEIFSFQPLGLTKPEPFVVSADGVAIQVIGRAGFDVASHYDRIKVAIRPQLPANAKSIDTLIVIEPAPQVDGPRIELPIKVRDRRWVRPATFIASAVSLGLIVSASVVSHAHLKVAFLGAGLLVALLLQWFGRPSIASLVGPAATAYPTAQASPTVVVDAAGGSPRALPPHSQ